VCFREIIEAENLLPEKNMVDKITMDNGRSRENAADMKTVTLLEKIRDDG